VGAIFCCLSFAKLLPFPFRSSETSFLYFRLAFVVLVKVFFLLLQVILFFYFALPFSFLNLPGAFVVFFCTDHL